MPMSAQANPRIEQRSHASDMLRVNETFVSVQGEGARIGSPSFFIRLDGCPLRCSWCDTPYALAGDTGSAMSVSELRDLASNYTHVVITGGEPLAQDIRELTSVLRRHHITVETSGTIFANLPEVSLFSISPKVGTSGYRPKPTVLRKFCASAAGRMQLKFVIGDRGDLGAALTCVQSLNGALPHGTPIILQPESGRAGRANRYLEFLTWLTEMVVQDSAWQSFDVRVLPQLHYLLWHGEPGR